MNVDCEVASYGFCGVLATQGLVVVGGGIGVGVRSLISSVEMTASGSNGTSPVARKPARTFSSPKDWKNAGVEGGEEVHLRDMVDVGPHQVVDLSTVRSLQWTETANVEWLEKMR